MIDNASNIKVGIENVEDIIEDIQQALDASKEVPVAVASVSTTPHGHPLLCPAPPGKR